MGADYYLPSWTGSPFILSGTQINQMRILTFKKGTYRDCPVYYRNMLKHFEYLTVINGEIYTAHLTAKPTIINHVLYWLGIEKTFYCDQQIKRVLKYLEGTAKTTIDNVLDGDKDKK